MSRYIDADALIMAMEQRYEDILRTFKRKVKVGEKAIVLDMVGCVKTAPSIDIVFCKECRYYHQLYGCQKNDDIDLVTSDDDYCSYGERSEE